MKTIAGSILILAFAIIVSSAIIKDNQATDVIIGYGLPIGIPGVCILVWGLVGERKRDKNEK